MRREGIHFPALILCEFETMPNPWESDVELSVDIASSLINSQFPELAPVRVEQYAAGWDNIAYLVNERYIFRFPHRKLGADLMENEVRALTHLAPLLPLAVPRPEFVGGPEGVYPYFFAGYPMIPGTTACRFAWTNELRAQNARPLGEFLRALHTITVDEETLSWAPRDTIERSNLAKRAPMAIERLRKIAPMVHNIDIEALIREMERLAQAPLHSGPPCWVHGDLYARHILVNKVGWLCGVIDWGDVHLGDPALDISIALSLLPPVARPEFEAAYGPIDQPMWDRAKFKAIFYGPPLVLYGMDVGDRAIRRAGEDALRLASQF